MSKPKRNHPCPCGSGRKYKSCCMKKEQEMENKIVTPHSLKNEFRDEASAGQQVNPHPAPNLIHDETERVGEAEMLRRDQFAQMRHMQVQQNMMARDIAFNEVAIEVYNRFLVELKGMPVCEAERSVAVMVMKQIEFLTKQVEQSKFARADTVILAALESVFAPTSEEIAQEQRDEDDSSEYVGAFGETAEELKDE